MVLEQHEVFGRVIMEDEIYRQILRMKALERWENEGGRVINDQMPSTGNGETKIEADNLFGADRRNDWQSAQQGNYEHRR